jgi:hypothetical protein
MNWWQNLKPKTKNQEEKNEKEKWKERRGVD